MADPALTAIRILDSVALLLVVGLIGLTWFGRDDREDALLLAMLVGIAVWVAGDLLVKLPVLDGAGSVLVDLQLTASAVTVTFMVWFVGEYVDRPEFRSRAAPTALAVEPVAFSALVWTNEAHGLVYPPGGPVVTAMRPALLVHALYSYFLVLLAVAFLVAFVGRANETYRRQATAIGVGAAVPLLGNAVYLFGPVPVDLTPVSYAVTGALLTYAVVRTDLLRLTPIARGTVLETTPVSVLVLGPDGTVLDANPNARQLVADGGSLAGRSAVELFDDHPGLADRLSEVLPAERRREFAVDGESRVFDVRVSPVAEGTGRRGPSSSSTTSPSARSTNAAWRNEPSAWKC